MAVVTFNNAANSSDYYLPDLFEFNQQDPNLQYDIVSSATRVTVTAARTPGVVTIVANGTGFTYRDEGVDNSGGPPLTGVVTSITLSVGGVEWMSMSGLSVELTDLDHFMFGWTRNGFYRSGDGYDLFSLFLAGNDTINGSDFGDDIIGGRNTGNDLINAGGGFDFIKADAGNDTIFGGADRDIYSLSESHYDGAAYRGANVNLQTGVATDSWGGTDTLNSIENLEGSRMADRFVGSGEREQFAGLRGNDTIDGGAGVDTVRYDRDEGWGGTRAVNVNLAAGTATDGWGNTDRLLNIEVVWGTRGNDTLVGNALDNEFSGGDGVDVVRGAAGRDVLDFYWDNVESGAIVELNRSTGQVRNDGFGNIETLAGIEDLFGTFLNDRFVGNDVANRLYGDAGNDTLSGGAGDDELIGEAGVDRLTGGAGRDTFLFQSPDGLASFGDTITDFVSGTDLLAFDTADFDGMDATLRFRNGTSAGSAGESWFFFNTATDRLFWDRDGAGGAAAVVVATLVGVNSLTTADIDLF